MSCSYCCRMTCALTRLCSIVFVVFFLAPRCDARRSLLAGDGNSEDLFAALSRQDSESIQLVQNLINGNSDKVNVHAQTSGGESTLHLVC